jgi:hypothetical protein
VRTGLIALALLLLPLVVALVLVLRHHHLDSGAVALVAGLSVGLPALLLAWVGYLKASSSGTGVSELNLEKVADQLAVAVRAQWKDEAAARRLWDPYPLPVSWVAADSSLTDNWELLVKIARSSAIWSERSDAWAAGPDELAGAGDDLVKVLARVPTGRLVVLGEPGAGKTMLMVRLVLDLLDHRTPGDPVPILASVASWNPLEQDLWAWLAAQLMTDHADLANPPPGGIEDTTLAAALLDSGLILPILDGLDEIPEQVRGPAISKINDVLHPGERLVVTCRSQQYQDAVRPAGGVAVNLRGAAAVGLLPLSDDAVRGYLCDDAADQAAKVRWDPVLAVLGTATPAGQAMTTPLMVGLARTIYSPRPGEKVGELPDPAELCDSGLADRTAVESLLFDAFIPAAYRQRPAGRSDTQDAENRWKTQDAEKWLVFLARYLERTIRGPDLAWWQLPRAPSRSPTLCGLVVGFVSGLVVGLGLMAGLGIVYGLVGGLVVGLGLGLVVGIELEPDGPSRRVQLNAGTLVAGLAGGVVSGVVLGLVIVLVFGLGFVSGFVSPLVFMLVFMLVFGLVRGLEGTPSNLAAAASPSAVLARDREAAFLIMTVVGLAVGLGSGLLLGLGGGHPSGLRFGLAAGLVSGLVFGLGASSARAAWPSYIVSRAWLASHHQLPWSLMSFLADAHRRGVLRQAGAVYQFRHIELQRRLATRPSDTAGTS